MLLYSLNVNGLKASINKGLVEFIFSAKPDIICLQETKCQDLPLKVEGYTTYWNFSERNSYSGTAIFTKEKALNCMYDFGDTFDVEGRIIILEFNSFYLINVYVPNSRRGQNRVNYRMEWDELFFDYVMNLERLKPVIICGDFNVALYKEEQDNIKKQLFINNELSVFNDLLNSGFVDAFKYTNPNLKEAITWVKMGKNKIDTGIGYRLDYFLVSNYLKKSIRESKILNNINISDHYPITLEIDIEG